MQKAQWLYQRDVWQLFFYPKGASPWVKTDGKEKQDTKKHFQSNWMLTTNERNVLRKYVATC
jgi:hypothetical protein